MSLQNKNKKHASSLKIFVEKGENQNISSTKPLMSDDCNCDGCDCSECTCSECCNSNLCTRESSPRCDCSECTCSECSNLCTRESSPRCCNHKCDNYCWCPDDLSFICDCCERCDNQRRSSKTQAPSHAPRQKEPMKRDDFTDLSKQSPLESIPGSVKVTKGEEQLVIV